MVEELHRYGLVDGGGNETRTGEAMAMAGVVEKPALQQAPSRLSVIDRDILPYRVMTLLADTSPGAGGEIRLTDAGERLIREINAVDAFGMRGGTFDRGLIAGWLQVDQMLAMQAGYLAASSREARSISPEPGCVDRTWERIWRFSLPPARQSLSWGGTPRATRLRCRGIAGAGRREPPGPWLARTHEVGLTRCPQRPEQNVVPFATVGERHLRG
ncbi:hypothetical protein [Halomonas maura]|uniref:hypothetical protein n=1 Tax=Halomonas maura TaxID=117606 RepID=UPI0025B5F656|nr:hypothetical protein [Halomonas maura]MDN3555260.1 hypothetical protein [Halomonas maura]